MGVAVANGFAVRAARLCGVQVASGGELDLSDGEISASTTGACVQVDGYDLARLTAGVRYDDNGINVDASSHAVPTPADPLPGF
jgi:hypothetical protein